MNKEQQRILRKNPLFKIGAVIILCALLISICGAFIRPDSSPFANNQYLELSALKPMTRVSFLKVRRNEIIRDGLWLRDHFVGKRSNYQYYPFDSISLKGDYLVLTRFEQVKSKEIHLLDAYYALANQVKSVQKTENSN